MALDGWQELSVMEVREMKQLTEENARLKQLVTDLSPDRHMLQEVIGHAAVACSGLRMWTLVAVEKALKPAQK